MSESSRIDSGNHNTISSTSSGGNSIGRTAALDTNISGTSGGDAITNEGPTPSTSSVAGELVGVVPSYSSSTNNAASHDEEEGDHDASHLLTRVDTTGDRRLQEGYHKGTIPLPVVGASSYPPDHDDGSSPPSSPPGPPSTNRTDDDDDDRSRLIVAAETMSRPGTATDPLGRTATLIIRASDPPKKPRALSLFIFPRDNCFRNFCIEVTRDKRFKAFILCAIVINSIFLAVDQPAVDNPEWLDTTLVVSEYIFTTLFILEAMIKIIALGFVAHKHSYLRSAWNVMDFIIVLASLIGLPFIGLGDNYSALRVFRVLRPLRSVSRVKKLKHLIAGLFAALPMVVDNLILLGFLLILFSITSVQLWMGELNHRCYVRDINTSSGVTGVPTAYENFTFPALVQNDVRACGGTKKCQNALVESVTGTIVTLETGCDVHKDIYRRRNMNYDNVLTAMLLNLKIIVLDNWPDNVSDSMDASGRSASLYFILLTLLGSFFCVNLFLAILTQGYAQASSRMQKKLAKERERALRIDQDEPGRLVDVAVQCDMDAPDFDVDTEIAEIHIAMDISDDNDSLADVESGDEAEPAKEDLTSQEMISPQVVGDDGEPQDDDDVDDETASTVSSSVASSAFYRDEEDDERHWTRVAVGKAVRSRQVEAFMMSITILNVIVLAIDHHGIDSTLEEVLNWIGLGCTILFAIEISLKIGAFGPKCLKNGFNLLDLILVLIAIPDMILGNGGGSGFSAFRVFRLLRVVRLLNRFESLQAIVSSVVHSVVSVAYLSLLILLFLYVFAIMGMQLYGTNYARGDPNVRDSFGTLWQSLILCFIVITGDDWTDRLLQAMGGGREEEISALFFFLVLYMVGNYILINLFVAIIMDKLAERIEHINKEKSSLPPALLLPAHRPIIGNKTVGQLRKSKSIIRLATDAEEEALKQSGVLPSSPTILNRHELITELNPLAGPLSNSNEETTTSADEEVIKEEFSSANATNNSGVEVNFTSSFDQVGGHLAVTRSRSPSVDNDSVSRGSSGSYDSQGREKILVVERHRRSSGSRSPSPVGASDEQGGAAHGGLPGSWEVRSPLLPGGTGGGGGEVFVAPQLGKTHHSDDEGDDDDDDMAPKVYVLSAKHEFVDQLVEEETDNCSKLKELLLRVDVPKVEGDSFYLFSPTNPFRVAILKVLGSTLFDIGINFLIFANMVFLAFESPKHLSSEGQDVLNIADIVFSVLFLIEMILKLIGFGVLWPDPEADRRKAKEEAERRRLEEEEQDFARMGDLDDFPLEGGGGGDDIDRSAMDRQTTVRFAVGDDDREGVPPLVVTQASTVFSSGPSVQLEEGDDEEKPNSVSDDCSSPPTTSAKGPSTTTATNDVTVGRREILEASLGGSTTEPLERDPSLHADIVVNSPPSDPFEEQQQGYLQLPTVGVAATQNNNDRRLSTGTNPEDELAGLGLSIRGKTKGTAEAEVTPAYLRDGWNVCDGVVTITAFIGIFVPAFTVFRSLRTVRLMIRNESTKIIIVALLQAIPHILNGVFLGVFLYLVFGILGVGLFKGTYYRCTDPDILYIGNCTGNFTRLLQGPLLEYPVVEAREWVRSQFHFDHLGSAVLALFVMSVGDGWSYIMYDGMDSSNTSTALRRDNRPWMSIYFIIVFVACNFFAFNMIIGILINYFSKMKKLNDGSALLTPDQRLYVKMRETIESTLFGDDLKAKENALSQAVDNVLTYRWNKNTNANSIPMFEGVITAVVLVNVAFLAAAHDGMSEGVSTMIDSVNLACLIIFTVEAALKIIAYYPPQYLSLNWNRFDFLIVVLGWVSVIFPRVTSISFLRVLRVSKLLRGTGAQKLIATIVNSASSFANVVAILLLTFFIFAVAGVTLFGEVVHNGALTSNNNFETVWNAMLVLYQIATTEGWSDFMEALSIEEPRCKPGTCGSEWIAQVYFVTFMVVAAFTVLQLFVAVIVEIFSDEEDECADELHDAFLTLKTVWVERFGLHARTVHADKFVQSLPYFPKAITDLPRKPHRVDLMRMVSATQIPINSKYEVDYRDVVYAFAWRKFNIDSKASVTGVLQDTMFSFLRRDPFTVSQLFAVETIQQRWGDTMERRRRERQEEGRRRTSEVSSGSRLSAPSFV